MCPELIEAKFGRKRVLEFLLSLAEKLTFRAADLVISANETFRGLAITRGGKRPEDVVTVYSIPDDRYFGSGVLRSRTIGNATAEAARSGAPIVIGYVGIIGDQDEVHNVVLMVRELVEKYGLEEFTCVIVGDGPALLSVKALAAELNVAEHIAFTGYLTGKELLEALSKFEIGVIPDPINCYNDKISMNKVFEYSAMGIPIVAMDLSETKRLLKDAAPLPEVGTRVDLLSRWRA